MPLLTFDPTFDSGSYPGPVHAAAPASAGVEWLGPARLVRRLELTLGVAREPASEQARAAALVPGLLASEGFWLQSSVHDPFGTARRLLQWRDMLLMAGWRGEAESPRLRALAELTNGAEPGLPDRIRALLPLLARRDCDIEHIELLTPLDDLAPLLQEALRALEQCGTRITQREIPPAPIDSDTDLARARGDRFDPQGDGTLILLRPSGQLAAAEEVAAWLASQQPAGDVVLVGSDAVLDAALHRHGLPTSGATIAANDAVPLQVLPLVLDLGWQPQDPQRAHELLSLERSPVPSELRHGLRRALERWPAVGSDDWDRAMAEGLAAIEDAARRERVKARMGVIWNAATARDQRYPIAEVTGRVEMLRAWFSGLIQYANGAQDDWAAALGQCNALLDQIRHADLPSLTAAQLRRLTVEATAGVGASAPHGAQAGVRCVGVPGGLAGPASRVVWWRFNEASAPGFMRLPLTRAERAELESQGVRLPDPGRTAAMHARHWRRPLEQATGALLLVCPRRDAAGGELFPHPLWDELVSRVEARNTRRVAESRLMRTSLAGLVPERRRALLPLPAPRREWALPAGSTIPRREKESPSSVETLLGCPFQWTLRYVGKLGETARAQVEDETSPRLLGDLLHAIMNRLFDHPGLSPEDAEREAGAIFDREGPRLAAALFLPGNDSQRGRVRLVATRTARALYRLMRGAGLTVRASEQAREGRAFGTSFEGRVDLVLGDPPRILDLKWGGAARREKMLESGTALQLAAYSFLEGQGDGAFPPVAFFIMERQRLLTTDPSAFDGAEKIAGPSPDQTWQMLLDTHAEEWTLVQRGQLEARGVVLEVGDEPPKEPSAEGGRIAIPPACQWCDYAALCGRAFEERA